MPDSTLSTLEQIRIKVRRLTRSPSVNQLSNQNIDDYVNTFVLYDFPEHLRIDALRSNFAFYTQPYIDVYENDTTNDTSLLYNFINKYTSFHAPLYINGNLASLELSQDNFFTMFPKTSYSQNIGTGDGVEDTFTGTLDNVPFLKNTFQLSSVDTNNDGITVTDHGDGLLWQNTGLAIFEVGTIDYLTGAYSVEFLVAPKSGETIYAQTNPYQASRPTLVLYYDSKFTVRPVPDRPYKIEMECFMRPTEILSDTQKPELAQWWQYIAYGAAKKVFEDRMDMESVGLIMPEFKKQELLVLRKTLVQHSDEAAATIFDLGPTGGGWSSGGNTFL